MNEFEKIIEDLKHYHRSKKDLQIMYINDRLNKSLQTYYKELSESFNYLSSRNEESVTTKMRRME